MGKSPGKWVKSIIFGKKTSKSGTPKGKPSSISAKDPASNLSIGLPSISEPVPVSVDEIKESSNFGKEKAAVDCDDEVAQTASAPNLALPEDSLKLEQAATKLQAAFRGHLVKRQAVATLYCLQGIVKLQALVRGQIIRRSIIGSEIFSKKILGNEEIGYFKSDTSSPVKEMVKNAFTDKLLSSLPTAMPLQIQYGPGEPNFVQEWLMRWTISQALGRSDSLPKHGIVNEPCGVTVSETKPDLIADLDLEQNENGNNNRQRRASLPAQQDIDTTRKVPSYMAPTKSARAKVRELGSPRCGQEVDEKNGLTRRYSLPFSSNGKLGSSPRVQTLIQASGKDGIKIDRSLSSSRDGSDKVIREEWKR